MSTAVAERFWAKVQGGGVAECWEWTAAKFGPKGYGCFRGGGRNLRAHRWAYEAMVATIPEGLQLDHLCENTGCVNPWHMEPVPDAVHKARGAQRRRETGRRYRPRVAA